MQNKLLIFFVVINFFFNNAFSNDQINFDVSEIEVLEGGNRIIGKKRGIIKTNDGIIINADNIIILQRNSSLFNESTLLVT